MSVPDALPARYWVIPLARAVVAVGVAIAVTFSADHSAAVGFATFGAFVLASGIVLAILSGLILPASIERSFFLAQGAIGVLAGVVSFATIGGGVAFLLFLMSAWAAITGFLELYVGIRSRGRAVHSRDWTFIGALTALLAVVVLLVPSGFEQQFTGPDDVARTLTASVILVGIFGAYAAIVAVYLAIGGLSLRWGTQGSNQAVVEGGH